MPVSVIYTARTRCYACHEKTQDFVSVKLDLYPHSHCLPKNHYKKYCGKISLQKHFVKYVICIGNCGMFCLYSNVSFLLLKMTAYK